MKKTGVTFFMFFIALSKLVFGQYACFDDALTIFGDIPVSMNRVNIDKLNYPQNIWQWGTFTKLTRLQPNCKSVVIITDSAKPYPINNVSAFTIKSAVTLGLLNSNRLLTGIYYVETDSLKDFGTIEFSPDCGFTWVDMLNDSKYKKNFEWFSKPILTGKTKQCQSFDVMFMNMASTFKLSMGDTVLFRFKFSSDSIFDNMAGIFYDNLRFTDFTTRYTDLRFNIIDSRVIKEVTRGMVSIQFENPDKNPFDLMVYDVRAKELLKKSGLTDNKMTLDLSSFAPDTYIYKLLDLKGRVRSCGEISVGE